MIDRVSIVDNGRIALHIIRYKKVRYLITHSSKYRPGARIIEEGRIATPQNRTSDALVPFLIPQKSRI